MDALINLWTELDESLASIMSKALIKFVYAMLVLLALLITYRVTKGLIIAAMRRSNRTEAQVMQFLSMWRYSFMLVGVVFVIVSLSGSLAAMGLTVAFISMILGWSLQRPVTGVAAWLMVMIKR
ncbi:MAG: hypothetical protein OXI86_12995, partial [Candidatus Poribacteria bacterium]|nr:hypothetical protein [Candidatus Poribacteria bacterium]